jgi:signal transduction histidine kinase
MAGVTEKVTEEWFWPLLATTVLGILAVSEAVARDASRPDATASGAVIAGAMVAPLALLRLWPVLAAGLSALACLLGLVTSSVPPVAGLIALSALYYAAAVRGPGRIAALLVAPFAVLVVIPTPPGFALGRSASVALLVLIAAAAAIGATRRQRAQTVQRVESERVAADSQLEYVARGERARIARELHDVVAHHISLIAVQAEAARLTTPGLPGEGAQRLVAIGDTARTALTEMRRLLGVLREDVDAQPIREPQPGLGQLTELLDEVRELGPGTVRLILTGSVRPVDRGIELTAYRIVQEALTNARRHAPGAAVDVELHYRDDSLLLRVRDNGPGPAAQPGTGLGLTGMRERAAAAGGVLRTGAGPLGGFTVEAVLPAGVAP